MKVVYILGGGHCGATLLDMVLGAHSQVVGVGEMHSAKPTAICTCGKEARSCPLWSEILGPEPWQRWEIFRPKWSYVFHRGAYRYVKTGEVVDVPRFSQAIVDQYHRLLHRTGKSVIVDTSKEVERTEVLAMHPEIEPVVIFLVRDGRGVTWSFIRKYRSWIPYVWMWASYNLKIELFRRRFRGPFVFLRYEDFVDHPEATLRKLCDRIGIAFEPGMLAFNDTEQHQIEGNRLRFVKGNQITRDDKWRREMPWTLRVVFNVCFGWLNAYYRHARSLD